MTVFGPSLRQDSAVVNADDCFIAALPAEATVLELGCGSGSPVAKHMAEHGLHVTGVDSSPTLISLCRERLPDHEWLVGDMRLLQVRRRFDGILAWDSFFHLTPDDQRWMFDVFARHAASSAVLMFNSGPAHGESVGTYRGDPLYHASLNPDEYAALLGTIGFEVVTHAVEDWQTGAVAPSGLRELAGFLHAQADADDFLLDEEGFQYRLTQDELDKLVLET